MVLSWGLPVLPPAYVEHLKQEKEASLLFQSWGCNTACRMWETTEERYLLIESIEEKSIQPSSINQRLVLFKVHWGDGANSALF